MIQVSRTLPVAAVFLIALALAACSDSVENQPDSAVRDLTTTATETTGATDGPRTTGAAEDQYPATLPDEGTTTALPERTGGLDPYRITLRLEGSEGVRFTGECETGGSGRSVEGRVPGKSVIETGGSELRCNIRKVGGQGRLRVVLTSEGQTRSVQQVGPGRGEVSVRYDPSRRGG